MVTAEVIISAPETREREDEVDESDDDVVRAFWRKMMARYDGEDAYNKTIVEQGPGSSTLSLSSLSWTS
jgi:type I restriction enzyme, R subunit